MTSPSRDVTRLLDACTRARSAPDAFPVLAADVRAAPAFADAWPVLRALLALPRSRVHAEALALAEERFRKETPEAVLRVLDADTDRPPGGVREAHALAVDVLADALPAADALKRLVPLLRDRNRDVRARATRALGALALHHPREVAPAFEQYARGMPLLRDAAARALAGLAARDLPTALRVTDAFVADADHVRTRLALVQLGFAYRYRPFDADERLLLYAALEKWTHAGTGPGKAVIDEATASFDAYNADADALADLARFRKALGVRPDRPPAPRPRHACGACGVELDLQAYFCHACGDVKAHNPMRRLDGLPVERGPKWRKP